MHVSVPSAVVVLLLALLTPVASAAEGTAIPTLTSFTRTSASGMVPGDEIRRLRRHR